MANVYETNEFRKNLKLEIDGVPYSIVDFQHVSPGKGSAFTRTKIRNLLTGNVIERNIKSGERIPAANTEMKEMQYLYHDAEGYHFMNSADYDQVALSEQLMGDNKNFLMENLSIQVLYYNERPIGIDLPTFVNLRVTACDPAIKGDTVSGAMKNATLETGAVIQVPLHIKEGDLLRVDTRDSSYSEKVNK